MRTKLKKLIITCGYIAYTIVKTPIIWYWKLFKIKTKGVRIMLIHEEKMILVRHWYNSLWVMPGGGIHKHETPEQAAIREIKEELGIDIKQLDYLLGVYSNIVKGKNDTVYCFVVELDSQIEISCKKFNIEISDIIWSSIYSFPPDTSSATKNRIQEYLASDISGENRSW